jgi:hypothetical protein
MSDHCRNSPDGLHHKGQSSLGGCYFCIHCGHSLVEVPPMAAPKPDGCGMWVFSAFVILVILNIVLRCFYS